MLWRIGALSIASTPAFWGIWLFRRYTTFSLQSSLVVDLGYNGEVSVEIDQNEILLSDKDTCLRLGWAAIESVQQYKGAFWLSCGMSHGVYIPSRLFRADQDRKIVGEMLDQFVSNS